MTAKADRKPGKAPKPGGIVPPLDPHYLAHELITQRGRAARLELVPLSDRFREALRWRLTRLLPIVAAPAYAELWQSADLARRMVLLEAIFQSGDYHYGASRRDLRQALARWLHARLAAADGTPARQAELVPCGRCGGAGRIYGKDPSDYGTCPACHGYGAAESFEAR